MEMQKKNHIHQSVHESSVRYLAKDEVMAIKQNKEGVFLDKVSGNNWEEEWNNSAA